MTTDQLVYLVFGVVILIALILDLGFLSKKNAIISIQQALRQTFFWVLLALSFWIFMWIEEGQKLGFEYLSGYLMEWSLSIDNIFVFILIFDAFKVKEQYIPRALLIGIIVAIIFEISSASVINLLTSSFETSIVSFIKQSQYFVSLEDFNAIIKNFNQSFLLLPEDPSTKFAPMEVELLTN